MTLKLVGPERKRVYERIDVRSFFAISGREVFQHGFRGCCRWAETQLKNHSQKAVLIASARAGEKQATIIAEYTKDGLHYPNGRMKKVEVKRLVANAKKEN